MLFWTFEGFICKRGNACCTRQLSQPSWPRASQSKALYNVSSSLYCNQCFWRIKYCFGCFGFVKSWVLGGAIHRQASCLCLKCEFMINPLEEEQRNKDELQAKPCFFPFYLFSLSLSSHLLFTTLSQTQPRHHLPPQHPPSQPLPSPLPLYQTKSTSIYLLSPLSNHLNHHHYFTQPP